MPPDLQRLLERDDDAGLGERHRLALLRGRDQIEGAELIVLAPASPVRELGHPAIDLGFVYRCVRRLLRERTDGGEECKSGSGGVAHLYLDI